MDFEVTFVITLALVLAPSSFKIWPLPLLAAAELTPHAEQDLSMSIAPASCPSQPPLDNTLGDELCTPRENSFVLASSWRHAFPTS